MSLHQYVRPPEARHPDDRDAEAPLYGHALTVGELLALLTALDPALPILLEGCDCDAYLGGVSLREDDAWYTRLLWLRRTTTGVTSVPVYKTSEGVSVRSAARREEPARETSSDRVTHFSGDLA